MLKGNGWRWSVVKPGMMQRAWNEVVSDKFSFIKHFSALQRHERSEVYPTMKNIDHPVQQKAGKVGVEPPEERTRCNMIYRTVGEM